MNGHVPTIDPADLLPGFDNAVIGSQAVFRRVLEAMSFPGRPVALDPVPAPPAGLEPAQNALLLTLADTDTPVWLAPDVRTRQAEAAVRFHCGAPVVDDAARAAFAVLRAGPDMPSLDAFDIGEDRYPDRSATLFVAVPALSGGPPVHLRGPGIRERSSIAPEGLPPRFWQEWAVNRTLFPQGVDVVLCSGDTVVGLPRGLDAEPE